MRSYICGLWVVCWGTCAVLAGSPAAVQRSGAAFEESPTPPASVLEPGWEERQKLLADDGAASDRFGWSVALSDDTALIGAYQDDDRGDDSGSAYVFQKINGVWTQAAKLTADDGEVGDNFGNRVALLGDAALVGAWFDDDRGENSGSAYVFEKVNGVWMQAAKLTADDGEADDDFGWSGALSGDTALVGAPNHDDRGENSGSAYVFQKVNGVWTQAAKLTADDGAAADYFGRSVALSGDAALIGALGDDDRGRMSGSAYVFEKVNDAWTQIAKLTAHDGEEADYFGGSVVLSGDTALVGARGDGDNRAQSGSAYVFQKLNGVWTQAAKLRPNDREAGDWFGSSVALSGDTALFGAWGDDDRGENSGSAYVFQKINGVWTQAAKLTADDGEEEDWFGRSVALSGDTALVGAILDDDRGVYSGSAYIFERTDVCTGNEAITSAKCKIKRGGVKQAAAFMQGGIPFAIYTAVLDSGEVAQDEANSIGQARFLFRGENAPECGPNGVTACNVRRAFNCGC